MRTKEERSDQVGKTVHMTVLILADRGVGDEIIDLRILRCCFSRVAMGPAKFPAMDEYPGQEMYYMTVSSLTSKLGFCVTLEGKDGVLPHESELYLIVKPIVAMCGTMIQEIASSFIDASDPTSTKTGATL